MDKFQFLLDWYNKEEDRKASVENSLNIPIGVLTLLFVVQFSLIKEFDFDNTSNFEQLALIVSLALSFMHSLGAGLYIFKSYHNFPNPYKYRGIPYPSLLLEHERKLINFYKDNAGHFPGETGEVKFQEYLQNVLANQIDANTNNNDDKYRFLNISKTLIFLSIITLLIACVPFLTNYFSKPNRPIEVTIINLDNINKKLDSLEYKLNQFKNGVQRRKAPTTDSTSAPTGENNKRVSTNNSPPSSP